MSVDIVFVDTAPGGLISANSDSSGKDSTFGSSTNHFPLSSYLLDVSDSPNILFDHTDLERLSSHHPLACDTSNAVDYTAEKLFEVAGWTLHPCPDGFEALYWSNRENNSHASLEIATSYWQPDEKLCGRHPNIIPVITAFQGVKGAYLIHPRAQMTLKNLFMWKRANQVPPWTEASRKFLLFQILQGLSHCHEQCISHGRMSPHNLLLKSDHTIWLSGFKQLSDAPSNDRDFVRVFRAWNSWQMSNYDYLMHLNRLSGRTPGNASCHPVMPWVMDFSCIPADLAVELDTSVNPHSCQVTNADSNRQISKANWTSGWRDLTRSKWRLTKGDEQLDATYATSDFPHHLPDDILTEVAVSTYLARKLPVSFLQSTIRSNFQPKEYPSNVGRLYDWSPDECIPELYTDPTIFSSQHEAMDDLAVPHWSPSVAHFLDVHRAALESRHVSADLHRWIDLSFGFQMSGQAAVEAKNVSVSSQLMRRCQLFSLPHPQRQPQPKMKGGEAKQLPAPSLEVAEVEAMDLFEEQSRVLSPVYGLPGVDSGDKAADLFGFGCIVAEVYLGRPLMDRQVAERYAEDGVLPSGFWKLPEHVKPLVRALLQLDPSRRPSSWTVLHSTFFEAHLWKVFDFLVPLWEQPPNWVKVERNVDQGRLLEMGAEAASLCVAPSLTTLGAHGTPLEASRKLLEGLLVSADAESCISLILPHVEVILENVEDSSLRQTVLTPTFLDLLKVALGLDAYLPRVHSLLISLLSRCPPDPLIALIHSAVIHSSSHICAPLADNWTVAPLLQSFGRKLDQLALSSIVSLGFCFSEEYSLSRILPAVFAVVTLETPSKRGAVRTPTESIRKLNSLIVIDEFIHRMSALSISTLLHRDYFDRWMAAMFDLEKRQPMWAIKAASHIVSTACHSVVAESACTILTKHIQPWLLHSLPALESYSASMKMARPSLPACSEPLVAQHHSAAHAARVRSAHGQRLLQFRESILSNSVRDGGEMKCSAVSSDAEDLAESVYTLYTCMLRVVDMDRASSQVRAIEGILFHLFAWKMDTSGSSQGCISLPNDSNLVSMNPTMLLLDGTSWSSPSLRDFQKGGAISRDEHMDPTRTSKNWAWLPDWEVKSELSDSWRGIVLHKMKAHRGSVKGVDINHSGDLALSVGRGKSSRRVASCWNLGSWECLMTYTGHGQGKVKVVKFLDSGSRAISLDGTVHVWSTETGSQLAVFQEPDLLSADLVAGGRHQKEHSESDSSKAHLDRCSNSKSMPRKGESSHSGGQLYSSIHTVNRETAVFGVTDGTLRLADLAQGQLLSLWESSPLLGARSGISSLSSSANVLFAGKESGNISLLDIRSGELIGLWNAHTASITKILPINNHQVMTSSTDRYVKLWDHRKSQSKPELLQQLGSPGEGIADILSHGSNFVFLCGNKIGFGSIETLQLQRKDQQILGLTYFRNSTKFTALAQSALPNLFLGGTKDGHLMVLG